MSSSVLFSPKHRKRPPKQDDILFDSESTVAQQATEKECQPYFVDIASLPNDQRMHLQQTGLIGDNEDDDSSMAVHLLYKKHIQYLSQIWKHPLKAPFVALDASRPWVMYWCLQGCDLLGELPQESFRIQLCKTLAKCFQSTVVELPTKDGPDPTNAAATHSKHHSLLIRRPSISSDQPTPSTTKTTTSFLAGGFGGGPGQIPHAAPTYAAILTLCILASDGMGRTESSALAYQFLEQKRSALYAWFLSLQTNTGGYRMHHDGEIDVRATYTIWCCAKLLHILTPQLVPESSVRYVQQCQTYEGGIGGEPWNEAHGGYTFCGLAALQLVGRIDVLDVDSLTGWIARRQMTYEGGYSGRCNKLVDGCYSFWQGSAMAICSWFKHYTNQTKDKDRKNNAGSNDYYNDDDDPWLSWASSGTANSTATTTMPPLLMDVPMLERYILLCAQDIHGGLRDKPSKSRDFYHSCYNLSGLSVAQHYTLDSEHFGHPTHSKVQKTHPVYNIRIDRVPVILKHFQAL